MGLAGDVLVFIADCEPICALQARVEILQAAAIESRARDGHFRFTSSGPLRLLHWSRGDRAGWKADVQIWVAKLGICPSRCRVSFTVQVLAQLDLLRNFAFLHSR